MIADKGTIMAVVNAESVDHFEKILTESDRYGNLVVVHFWTPWASQCKQMSDVMEELAKDVLNSAVKFVQVEAEDLPELSQKYTVSAVPTFVLLKNNREVGRINGANPPELTKTVESLCRPNFIPPPFKVDPKEELEARLKSLINGASCMLFMKGSPNEPRCGFSKQTIELLKKHNAQFSTFDILSDDSVRQGLKTYSDWPTYPQLYIKGELIGGLDILKELDNTGELATMLPKQEDLNARLKGLISKSPIMVFIKGNRDQPRCGFSKTLVGIFNEMGTKYETFDILEDEDVRQGLKTYSDWPTYPQVYVKGEFVGGLDIIKELKESGELSASLNPKQ